MRMKKKIYLNSMVTKILAVVTFGLLCGILMVTVIIISISKSVFVDTYGESQKKVFFRIENELNSYHEDLMKLFNQVNSSWNLKLYLQQENSNPQQAFKIAYSESDSVQHG